MGDTGSLILGLILAVCAVKHIESTIGGNEIIFKFSPILSLAILAIPIFDMVRLFGMRIFNRKSPFSPDMNHIHHIFLRLGLTHLKSTAIIVLSNLFIIGFIFYLKEVNNHILLLTLICLVATLILLPTVIYELKKSRNSEAARMQIQSHFIPYKTVYNRKIKTALSNTIVYLNEPLDKQEKKKNTIST